MPSEPAADATADAAPDTDAVLDRLRSQVQRAITQIEQLRAENEALKQRIRQLEERPAVGDDETFLLLDDDPATLRRQIEGFIASIDAYLDDADPETHPADDA